MFGARHPCMLAMSEAGALAWADPLTLPWSVRGNRHIAPRVASSGCHTSMSEIGTFELQCQRC